MQWHAGIPHCLSEMITLCILVAKAKLTVNTGREIEKRLKFDNNRDREIDFSGSRNLGLPLPGSGFAFEA